MSLKCAIQYHRRVAIQNFTKSTVTVQHYMQISTNYESDKLRQKQRNKPKYYKRSSKLIFMISFQTPGEGMI